MAFHLWVFPSVCDNLQSAKEFIEPKVDVGTEVCGLFGLCVFDLLILLAAHLDGVVIKVPEPKN